jgi:lipid IVA palmitoyltransferase
MRRPALNAFARLVALSRVAARRAAAVSLATTTLAWTHGAHAASCSDLYDWIARGCRRIADTYERGDNGILLSGYAWHLPSTWTPEKRAEENEEAWGGGVIRTLEDSEGNTQSVYFLAFKDSHSNVQFNLGYEQSWFWGPRDGLQGGLGYTVAIIQRPDIASGVPLPVVAPLFQLRVRQATLMTTFIPTIGGDINKGSVLYVFGRYIFK